MFWIQLVLAGIATGCIYSLAGMGVVLTYKATGIFNFAHGAIAMLVAYTLWQMRTGWRWPLLVAAPVAILVVGPGIGVLLERVVFRPLQRRGATASQKLVATLGVFLVCLGVAYGVWTGKLRQAPHLVSNRSVHLAHDLAIGFDQLSEVVLVVVVCLLLWLLFRNTKVGTDIRAVVDRRELSELAGINANRVASLAWALGCGLAGLTGILFAGSTGLDPFHLTLVVIETFSIAVVARLVSLPIAVGAGILVLGVIHSLLTAFKPHVFPLIHWHVETVVGQLVPNLSVLVLFGALLLYRNLDEVGEADSGTRGLVSLMVGRAGRSSVGRYVAAASVAVVGILLPFVLSHINLPYAQTMLALVIVFASIVCVTGFSGHVTLGQAAFAGTGAFFSTRVANAFGIPVIIAMVIGGLTAVIVGFIAGFPALRRRGVFLGLTTLAIGYLLFNTVFSGIVFGGGTDGLTAHRPTLFGLSLAGDRAFYWFELVWVALMLLLARNLRSGRLGRILAAMRDSEMATRSIGIDLRAYKLFIFAVSAFIAGIGGSLIAQQEKVFQQLDYSPFTSLLWFTAVIVAGIDSIGGAIVAAVVVELLEQIVHVQGISELVIALGALFLIPRGASLMTVLRRAALIAWTPFTKVPSGLVDTFSAAREGQVQARARMLLLPAGSPPASIAPGLVPSEFALRVLAPPGADGGGAADGAADAGADGDGREAARRTRGAPAGTRTRGRSR